LAATEREVTLALKDASAFQGQKKWPEALEAAKRHGRQRGQRQVALLAGLERELAPGHAPGADHEERRHARPARRVARRRHVERHPRPVRDDGIGARFAMHGHVHLAGEHEVPGGECPERRRQRLMVVRPLLEHDDAAGDFAAAQAIEAVVDLIERVAA